VDALTGSIVLGLTLSDGLARWVAGPAARPLEAAIDERHSTHTSLD